MASLGRDDALVNWTIATLLLATLICLAAVAAIWSVLRDRVVTGRARRLVDGTQEARVVVDRGYAPSRIELEAGVPTVLRFERREDDPCTEMLVCELLPSEHRLVAHGETRIRFTPPRPGRYAFTCGMGMYSGELVVRSAQRKES